MENTVGKEELACNEQFLLFPQCYLPFGKLPVSAIFIKFKIVVCKCFQFGRVQNLLFGKGLKGIPDHTGLISQFCRCCFNFCIYIFIQADFLKELPSYDENNFTRFNPDSGMKANVSIILHCHNLVKTCQELLSMKGKPMKC